MPLAQFAAGVSLHLSVLNSWRLIHFFTPHVHLRGYAFNSTADFELVRELKEKYCFVCGDLALERKLAKETTIHEKEVRLPDNTCIKIGRERFEACELLFSPYYGGYECPGVAEIVFQSIMVRASFTLCSHLPLASKLTLLSDTCLPLPTTMHCACISEMPNQREEVVVRVVHDFRRINYVPGIPDQAVKRAESPILGSGSESEEKSRS